MEDSPALPDSPFRLHAFRLLFLIRMCSNGANQMLAVAVGWQIYELTGSAVQLGMIGLVQFLPPLLLTLPVGQLVDRYNRRIILRLSYACELLVTVALLLISLLPEPSVIAIFAVLFVNAVARTCEGPTLGSLVPVMVPRRLLAKAMGAHAAANKIALLAGPSLGGLLYAFGPDIVYGCCISLVLAAAVASLLLPATPPPENRPAMTWESVLAGFGFVRRTETLFGAISLDLATTLFGSVHAILPIFARDILEIGPWGFGLLRSAPALGALTVAAVLARYPVRHRAGHAMFCGLAVYGVGTILFALSDNAVLSILLLLAVGAGEMLSTVIRHTLVQMGTPDAMRGRVLALQSLSVSTSGQIGMFESGVTAAWFGAVGSVLFGGVAVLAILGVWAWRFPALRLADRPDQGPETMPEPEPQPTRLAVER